MSCSPSPPFSPARPSCAPRSRTRRSASPAFRAPREIAYSAIGAAYGLAGLALVLFWLAPSVWLSVTVLGTAARLLLTMGGLRAARVLASLQRRTLALFVRVTVDPPPSFEPGSGLPGGLKKRLKDQAAWRAVAYCLHPRPRGVSSY